MSETPRSAPSPTDAAKPQVRQPRQMPTPAIPPCFPGPVVSSSKLSAEHNAKPLRSPRLFVRPRLFNSTAKTEKTPSLADLNSDCDDSADEKKRSACYNLAVRVALPAQPQCFSILVSGSANEKSQLQCDRSNAKGLKHESRNSLCSSVGLTLCLHRVGSQFHPAARPGTTSPCRSLGLRAHLQSYRRRPHH